MVRLSELKTSHTRISIRLNTCTTLAHKLQRIDTALTVPALHTLTALHISAAQPSSAKLFLYAHTGLLVLSKHKKYPLA
jgi:hypothetical protein